MSPTADKRSAFLGTLPTEIVPAVERQLADCGAVFPLSCQACHHEWYSCGEDRPVKCPRCRSEYWDRQQRPRSVQLRREMRREELGTTKDRDIKTLEVL